MAMADTLPGSTRVMVPSGRGQPLGKACRQPRRRQRIVSAAPGNLLRKVPGAETMFAI